MVPDMPVEVIVRVGWRASYDAPLFEHSIFDPNDRVEVGSVANRDYSREQYIDHRVELVIAEFCAFRNKIVRPRKRNMPKNYLVFTWLVGVVLCMGQSKAQEDEVAEATPATTSILAPSDSTPSMSSSIRPITVSVSLVDENTLMTGTLIDSNTLSIKTAFGLAELPLTEVAGVRFPRGEDTATTVVMLNGDSITGATDLKFVSIETTWGSAKINGQSISSMLFVPGLAWQPSDVLGSRRWQLVEVSSVPTTPQNVQPGLDQPSRPQAASGQPFPVQPRPAGPTPGGAVRINN